MCTVPFKQVDVFTDKPFKGNPVAVIMAANGLNSEQMQTIANWTNLSETTFVLPPLNNHADYRVRIFTPKGELPFAGHPTIGTAYALLEEGIISASNGQLVQECQSGLIELNVSQDIQQKTVIAFKLPSPQFTVLTQQQIVQLEDILGCDIEKNTPPCLVNVGAKWIVIQVKNAQKVLEIQPDYEKQYTHDQALGITGICVYGVSTTEPQQIEVRSFAPSCGVNEDPVCGSGNGSVAAFIRHYNTSTDNLTIYSTQGQILGRDGHLQLQIMNSSIFVGGNAVTCIKGTISI